MTTPREISQNLYQSSPTLFFIGLVIMTMIIQMITSTTYLLFLSQPRAIIFSLIFVFSMISTLSYRLSWRILDRFSLVIPTVMLWFYPLFTLGMSYIFLLSLLVVLPSYAGRGYWSDLAHLNAKTTTIMFTTTIVAFKLFVAISFVGALFHYIKYILQNLGSQARTPEEIAIFEQARQRGSHFNRWSFLFSGLLVFVLGCWVVFIRPETVLYYRGEVQLRTGLNPEVALETFRHLARKYPTFKYLDTVEFRTAWVLERRMKQYQQAIEAYQAFLLKFGFDNVWADEAFTNLIRLFLDKLKQPQEALKWIAQYRQRFNQGQMLPHLALYEIRALIQENRRDEARKAFDQAMKTYKGAIIILYDNEDDFAMTILFESAAAAIDLSPTP